MKKGRIAASVIPYGNGFVKVSTVDLVLTLPKLFRGSPEAPYTYETMVFKCDAKGKVLDWESLDTLVYSNIEEAKLGHQQMVDKYSKGCPGPE